MVWKVSSWSGKFPDSLEIFLTVWKVSGQYRKFPDCLESFQTVWKLSRQIFYCWQYCCNIHILHFCKTHVLRPLHFRHWIKALCRPSTKTNLCYLKFDLTNCSWEKNCLNCKSAMRSVEVAKLPQRNPLRYLFQWKGQKSTLSPSFITFIECQNWPCS